ncbi:MAG: hypothetical protein J0L96_08965 [Anaerolineae bacterium]|jgi:hypothetical protein|nr:hypothetical protein [Anaerolineae bacterium]
MKRLKENKLLQFALGTLLLVLLCFNFPNLLFFSSLCIKEDIFRPPHTEVIVSACKQPFAIGVPGGEDVFIYEGRTDKMYLLDLRTGEKRKIPDDPLFVNKGVFLSSDLVWLEGSLVGPYNPDYSPHYVLDLKEGKRYELLDLTWVPLKDGKFDVQNYSYFQSAERIYIHHNKLVLIALSPNFREQEGNDVIFFESTLGIQSETHQDGAQLDALMQDLGLEYITIDLSLEYTDVPSPMGNYTVRKDGVYDLKTNSIIMTPQYVGMKFSLKDFFKGWYYDETGLVVQEVEPFLFSHPFLGSYYLIPKPVLKLPLPVTP